MQSGAKAFAVPILIIAMGVGLLLSSRGILPEVNWIWVIGLGLAGAMLMALNGIDRFTAVVGPWLICAMFLSLLRQTGRLELATEIPVLIILLGALMVIARLLPLPAPAWMREQPPRE